MSALLLLFLSAQSIAGTLILIPENTKARQIATELTKGIPDSEISTTLTKDAEYDLIITVGNQAFLSLGQNLKTPHIAAFVSYNLINSVEPTPYQRIAVYNNPSPIDLQASLRKYFGEAEIGYIYSDPQEPYLNFLKSSGVNIADIALENGDVFKSLRSLYSHSKLKAFYISENRNVFDRKNILYVLESLYRNRIASISSNIALQSRGTLLSIVVEESDIIQKTISIAKNWKPNATIEPHNFVKPRIIFDDKLAQSIDIVLEDSND